ncbi:MAG: DUF5362 family protein [Mucilaginibacter sp.]|uniref:DUF5362 family protein n=1 Tax=Mucilaginibacter sp. L3T2-6 TaxID=3062491 RepID=UPI002675EC04|nr:DUF5362 family protein [Mucilaginibacter sp. L3T2-6]MDO3641163.1 DUF5362 family protein [Mucilaginibacter sp. L3T2-6]MDV6213361.1 DUF5362 family protein [Mucilaginibacter sp. L3T2-6]
METTDSFEMADAAPSISLNYESQTYLRESGKWAAFLGIIGFIFTGFIAIAALFAGTMMATLSRLQPDNPGAAIMSGMGGFITVIYLLIGLLYFFFSLFLYQFGSRIKKGIMYADQMHVTAALGKLKSFFKLWGILTIVILCLYALIIIGAIIFGITASSMMNR